MAQDKQLFFIALLLPAEIRESTEKLQHHFALVYNSRAALKSPPHITLQPPFQLEEKQLPALQEKLTNFVTNYQPIPIILDNFNAFKPRVIYLDVMRTPELWTLQKELISWLNLEEKPQQRPFVPHVTLAFRDLTKDNFRKAWLEFKDKNLHYEFASSELTLLKHNQKKWQIYQQFSFKNQNN